MLIRSNRTSITTGLAVYGLLNLLIAGSIVATGDLSVSTVEIYVSAVLAVVGAISTFSSDDARHGAGIAVLYFFGVATLRYSVGSQHPGIGDVWFSAGAGVASVLAAFAVWELLRPLPEYDELVNRV